VSRGSGFGLPKRAALRHPIRDHPHLVVVRTVAEPASGDGRLGLRKVISQENERQGRLALAKVSRERLPNLRLVALIVQQIVDDLERKPDVVAVEPKRFRDVFRSPRQARTDNGARLDERRRSKFPRTSNSRTSPSAISTTASATTPMIDRSPSFERSAIALAKRTSPPRIAAVLPYSAAAVGLPRRVGEWSITSS
jgi:hypothetical protein